MSSTDKNNFVISASIKGSHVNSAIIDLNRKEIVDHTRIRLKLYSHATSEEILEIVTSALKQTEEKFDLPIVRIALAIPSPSEYENGICLIKDLPKYEAIYDLNIKQYISVKLNIKSENILFRNDVEAFLHGEITTGIEARHQAVIGITLDQRLEVAKSRLGVTRYINLMGSKLDDYIIDESFSTRFLVDRYFEISRKTVLNVEVLAKIAEEGDKIALLIFKQFTYSFCFFLKDLINAQRADVVVIGGDITKVSRLFFKPLIYEMAGYFEDIDIKIAHFCEDSTLIGAAASFDVNREQNISIKTDQPDNSLQPIIQKETFTKRFIDFISLGIKMSFKSSK